MRFEQVQRFILAKKIFWSYGHFKAMNKYPKSENSSVFFFFFFFFLLNGPKARETNLYAFNISKLIVISFSSVNLKSAKTFG